MEHQERKRYEKWRKRAVKQLPKVSARVFAARQIFYNGCGFHYGLEKKLGYCIWRMNNHDDYPKEWWDVMLIQMAFAEIFKELQRIEATNILTKPYEH